MIQTISVYDFRDAFKRCGRGDQFSYEGLELIFDYIEEDEGSTGEQVELDVIGICCEWAEDSPENIADQYGMDIDGLSEQDARETVLENLSCETQVAGVTDAGNIVYVQF